MIKKIIISILFIFFNAFLFAQDNNGIQMADTMRSNGKIYVVIAVILTIFAGLILYLIRLDKKISRLENNQS